MAILLVKSLKKSHKNLSAKTAIYDLVAQKTIWEVNPEITRMVPDRTSIKWFFAQRLLIQRSLVFSMFVFNSNLASQWGTIFMKKIVIGAKGGYKTQTNSVAKMLREGHLEAWTEWSLNYEFTNIFYYDNVWKFHLLLSLRFLRVTPCQFAPLHWNAIKTKSFSSYFKLLSNDDKSDC